MDFCSGGEFFHREGVVAPKNSDKPTFTPHPWGWGGEEREGEKEISGFLFFFYVALTALELTM